MSLLGSLISEISTLYSNRALQLKRAEMLKRRLDPELIKSLDTDGSGVDKCEFVVGMLIKLGLVDEDDVAPYLKQFDALDTDGSGVLTPDDLEQIAAQTAERLSAASPAAAKAAARARGARAAHNKPTTVSHPKAAETTGPRRAKGKGKTAPAAATAAEHAGKSAVEAAPDHAHGVAPIVVPDATTNADPEASPVVTPTAAKVQTLEARLDEAHSEIGRLLSMLADAPSAAAAVEPVKTPGSALTPMLSALSEEGGDAAVAEGLDEYDHEHGGVSCGAVMPRSAASLDSDGMIESDARKTVAEAEAAHTRDAVLMTPTRSNAHTPTVTGGSVSGGGVHGGKLINVSRSMRRRDLRDEISLHTALAFAWVSRERKEDTCQALMAHLPSMMMPCLAFGRRPSTPAAVLGQFLRYPSVCTFAALHTGQDGTPQGLDARIPGPCTVCTRCHGTRRRRARAT